jgi:hypothetical protein
VPQDPKEYLKNRRRGSSPYDCAPHMGAERQTPRNIWLWKVTVLYTWSWIFYDLKDPLAATALTYKLKAVREAHDPASSPQRAANDGTLLCSYFSRLMHGRRIVIVQGSRGALGRRQPDALASLGQLSPGRRLTLLQIPTTGYPPRKHYASKPRIGRREQPQRELGTAGWFSSFRQV